MNNISISKAKKLLQHQLNILWETPEKSDLVPPLMIWGRPELVNQHSSENSVRRTTLVSLMLDLHKESPLISEAYLFRGMTNPV